MDEKDIAPELLERIRADFLALLGDAQQEADTYTAAAAYAELVGSALADAFRRNLTADILPDGRLYWNIADRVVRPLLEEDYARIADAAAAAQQALNRAGPDRHCTAACRAGCRPRERPAQQAGRSRTV